MPYIYRHAQTGLILTTTLVNHYDLEYYGTQFWGTREAAVAAGETALSNHHYANPKDWQVLEVDEQLMKIINVRLRNDASLRLLLEEDNMKIIREDQLP